MHNASVADLLAPESLHDIGNWLRLALRNLLVTEGEDLQKRHRLLGLLVTGYVLENGFCLTVLRDDERLALLVRLAEDVRRVRHHVANGLHLGGIEHEYIPYIGPNIVL
jgi:hypothetical protein